jgi:hypothetical protein
MMMDNVMGEKAEADHVCRWGPMMCTYSGVRALTSGQETLENPERLSPNT